MIRSDSTADCRADRQDGWMVAAPEQHGFDPTLLSAMVIRAQTRNVHAITLARHGVLVFEHYFEGEDACDHDQSPARVAYNAQMRHNINSVTKSVTSLLVGIAVDRGWLSDLDASVFSFFPEYAGLRTPEKERITLRHLLTMADGLEWYEFQPPFDSNRKLRDVPDPYRYVLERQPMAPAGCAFNYNTGATVLLAKILCKATGKTIDALAKDLLFEPLGVGDVEWIRHLRNGDAHAGAGLRLRPRDVMKIGQLVLDGGRWRGRQIVPAAWVSQSITPQNNGPGAFLYGFQWWLGRSYVGGRIVDWAGGFGWGGQRLIIVPEHEMVAVTTAWLPQGMDFPERTLLNEYMLPALVDP